MKQIKRIVIKSESGWLAALEDAYKDKIVLTKDSIKYVLNYLSPLVNDVKWSYKSNSGDFVNMFNFVCACFPACLNIGVEYDAMDIGATEFQMTYEDGSRENKTFYVISDAFYDLFAIINVMCPIRTVTYNRNNRTVLGHNLPLTYEFCLAV